MLWSSQTRLWSSLTRLYDYAKKIKSMELPKLFSKLKTQDAPKETFLAIEIDPATVKSAVWAVDGKKTVVLKMGSVEEWEEDKEDSLITSVDNSVTNASEEIEPEPNKVILGLTNTWLMAVILVTAKKHY